jgi:hypothetical protein
MESPRQWGGISAARHVLLALACLLVAACSQQALLEKFSSPQDRALSTKLIQSLQSGDTAYILSNLRPDLRDRLLAVLPSMRQVLPAGADTKLSLVDASYNSMTTLGSATTRRSYLAYEIDQGSRHALVRIGIERKAQDVAVTDLYVNSLAKPISELTSFTLTGKSAIQYLFLALAAMSFATIVTSFVVLFRSKGIKRKWLWTIGCLFGFGQFTVDWSTGAVTFAPLYFQLFGAFAIKSPMISAWRVGFGIPIFAVAFLILRRRLQPRSGSVETGDTQIEKPL